MTFSLLLAIILLEGFVTISVEILAIRQLLPFVGNNVIVTSLIIGIFLLFLAIGYWRGGTYKENYRQILKNNFTASFVLIGIGLSYFFAEIFFDGFNHYITHNTLTVLICYLFLIIAPIVYILGQTVPITTNLFQFEQHIGTISGRVLYISTLGSFLGAVLTSLLLFTYLGVAWTVVLNSFILGILTLALVDSPGADAHRVGFLIAFFCIIVWLNVKIERHLFITTNNYGNYTVVKSVPIDNKTGDILVINRSFSSFLDRDQRGSDYIEAIKKILFDQLQLRDKRILILGAGGFTFSADNRSVNNHVTYLDIDRDIKKIVTEHYQPKINGDFIAADARSYLQHTDKRYDVIVTDTYNNRITIPSYLLTVEHLKNIHRVLNPNGLAVFNIILNPLLTDAYSKRVDTTIAAVFHSCMKIPLSFSTGPQNVLYVCHKNTIEHDKTIYSDNINRANVDFYQINER